MKPKVCITPKVTGSGGMASFRLKFEQGLSARGVDVTYDLSAKADAVLVIAGTKNLWGLNQARKRGTRIVQRLDGVNWVQRVKWSGVRYTVRAAYGNFMLALIRKHVAERVIYQSRFIQNWWEDWYGVAEKPAQVILNGVDLDFYNPHSSTQRPLQPYRLLLLEGSLARGLNSGLFHGVAVAEKLAEKYPMEVAVAGTVDEATQRQLRSKVPVKFLGTLPREEIPQLIRSAHLLYCAEVNPPCPNSVIEALACGLPVIGFDTGSLKELLGAEAGVIVPYGANPWKLEMPNVSALAEAAGEVLEKQNQFRAAARRRAESTFSLDAMVESYLKILLED
ncbi:MAG: glycosyltransferase family 4 protein [Anaerolineales bacterium]|nr:glycosyltransferase family 4 protein [Anaerolineales bacterium]